MKIFLTVHELKLYSGQDFHKKHKSTKIVCGVTILVLCTLSDGGLF